MPDFPTTTGASGIWTLKKQKRFQQGDNWPLAIAATGGTVTTSAGYTYHTYTTSGTFTPLTSGPLTIEYLTVAGGGGGSDVHGGGGGAGGFLSGSSLVFPGRTYSIIIGAGGAGGNYEGGVGSPVVGVGLRGTNTSIDTVAIVQGGGGGGNYDTNPTGTFGSGGGGGGQNRAGISGITGQGNSGGSGQNPGAGGGGGAGLPGSNANNGSGGDGLQFPINSNGWSNYFDGSGDYLELANNAAFSFGSGDFTIEFWIDLSSTNVNGRIILDARTASNVGYAIHTTSTNGILLGNVGATVLTSTTTLTPSSWSHVAVVKSSGVISMYINGIQSGSVSYATAINSSGGIRIGYKLWVSSAVADLLGYISNLRIVKGTAIYTSNFVPPIQPLTAVSGTSLLTCQNNTIRDNSTNNFTITTAGNTVAKQIGPFNSYEALPTSYSAYFDGNGDYLTIPFGSSFVFNSNFTIEGWFNASSLPTTNSQKYLIASWNASSNLRSFYVILLNTAGVLSLSIGLSPDGTSTNSSATTSNPITLNLGQWYHFAICRSGNTITHYIDGISVGSGTNSISNFGSGSPVSIGADAPGLTTAFYWNGYISNVRIVKGTAVYTTNFTPPTLPLTQVSGTALLTCQDNTFKDNSTNNFAVTASGNVVPTLQNPFGTDQLLTSYSAYFDGTGDYLTIPASAVLNLFGGSFTIETWINPVSFDTNLYNYILVQDDGGSNSQNFILRLNATGAPQFTYYTTSTRTNVITITGSSNLPLNTWSHLAVVYNSSTTTLTIYLNGSSVGSSANAPWAGASVQTAIGNWSTGVNQTATYSKLNCFISNLRLIKGTALYTTNFTPSTRPLTAVTGTSLLTCQDNIFKDNSTNNFALTATGNVAPSLSNPFLDKTYYAGGGGGAWSTSTGPITLGGIGGGGNGSWNSDTVSPGFTNTGGGGGGVRSNDTTLSWGRPGGSGIVVIRYPNPV